MASGIVVHLDGVINDGNTVDIGGFVDVPRCWAVVLLVVCAQVSLGNGERHAILEVLRSWSVTHCVVARSR